MMPEKLRQLERENTALKDQLAKSYCPQPQCHNGTLKWMKGNSWGKEIGPCPHCQTTKELLEK